MLMMVMAMAYFIFGNASTIFHHVHEVMIGKYGQDPKDTGTFESLEFRLQFDKTFGRWSFQQRSDHKYAVGGWLHSSLFKYFYFLCVHTMITTIEGK